jgi:hypothetical protein
MKITISKSTAAGHAALSGLLAGLFLVASCFTGLETPEAPGEGKGLVRVFVGGNQRTLLPELPELKALYYTLVVSAGGMEDVSASIPTGGDGASVELAAGTWTVTAKGFVSEAAAGDAAAALVEGSAPVEVAAGTDVSVRIPLSLRATLSATGTLHYEARALGELELDPDTDTADLVINPLSEGASPAVSLSLLEQDKDSGDIPLNAGYYRLSVSWSKYDSASSRSIRAGKTDVVHIYDSLTTRWEDEVNTYPYYSLSVCESITDLLEVIDGVDSATEANPYYVALRGSYTVAELNTLFTDIKGKARHITLDLTDCAIESITTSLTNPQYVVSLILPKALKTLGNTGTNNVFKGWTSLKSVAFPQASALETVGTYLFLQCTGLVSADLSGCTALKSTDSTFYGCTALQEVKLPDSLETLGQRTFQNCFVLASAPMPASLKTIGDYAFSACGALTSIKLPASLETIRTNVFGNTTTVANACKELKEVVVYATTPPALSSTGGFSNTHAELQIKVPAASVDAYKAATTWSAWAARIVPIEE